MAQFKFNLESVLGVRISERRQQRVALAEAIKAEQILLAQLREVQAEIHSAKQRARDAVSPGSIDVGHLMETQRYVVTLETQARGIELKRQQVEVEVERRRTTLVEADQQVQVLEKLRDKQRTEFERAERIKEQRETDEMSLRQTGVVR